jgi:hypothetical protein
MYLLKKQLFFILFTLSAALFAAGSVSAQTWTAVNPSVPNACGNTKESNVTTTINCVCPQGYSLGTAVNANCTMSGFIPGCWNPNNGTCNTCGSGGTIVLGQQACFNNGQNNSGNPGTGTQGVACTQSSQCANGGTSGGNSTN